MSRRRAVNRRPQGPARLPTDRTHQQVVDLVHAAMAEDTARMRMTAALARNNAAVPMRLAYFVGVVLGKLSEADRAGLLQQLEGAPQTVTKLRKAGLVKECR